MSKEFWATIGVVLTVTTGQFLWLRSDIQGVETRLGDRIQRTEVRLENRIARVDSRIDRLENRISRVESTLSAVKEDVDVMRGLLMSRIDDANLTAQNGPEN